MAAGGPGDQYLTDVFIYGTTSLLYEDVLLLAELVRLDPRLAYYAHGTMTEDNRRLDAGPGHLEDGRLDMDRAHALFEDVGTRIHWFDIDSSDLESKTKVALHRVRKNATYRLEQLRHDGRVHGQFV